jgi:hypothetical protein
LTFLVEALIMNLTIVIMVCQTSDLISEARQTRFSEREL